MAGSSALTVCLLLFVVVLSSLLCQTLATCDCNVLLSNALKVPTACANGGGDNSTRCSSTCNDARVLYINSLSQCIGQTCPNYSQSQITQQSYDDALSRCEVQYSCCYTGIPASCSSYLSGALLSILKLLV